MEIDNLNLFIDIARAGSFAEAARRSDLDASLVSRRIATLEKELGFRLFQRTTRTISLTESERGLQHVQRLQLLTYLNDHGPRPCDIFKNLENPSLLT